MQFGTPSWRSMLTPCTPIIAQDYAEKQLDKLHRPLGSCDKQIYRYKYRGQPESVPFCFKPRSETSLDLVHYEVNQRLFAIIMSKVA